MSSSGVSLLQMPEIPMKHILEYLEFPSILVLRKVSNDLRNFIDDTKPAFHLTHSRINVYSECIEFILSSQTQRHIPVFYEKCSEGCLVKKYHDYEEIKRTTLKNEDFVTVFCKDFDIIFRHQKTVLEHFRIHFSYIDDTIKERVLERVSKAFKSLNHPLQVKLLWMVVNDHNEILTILPYIDPKPLELINISERSRTYNSVLKLDEIGQLEQWKQAGELVITEFQLPDLAQNIKNCSNISLGYRKYSIEELILLKDIFLCSVTLNKIEVYIDDRCSAVVGPRLIEKFGEPLVDTDEDKNWFIRIPDTIQFLRITLKYCYIYFNRIEQSDVPQNAIILN